MYSHWVPTLVASFFGNIVICTDKCAVTHSECSESALIFWLSFLVFSICVNLKVECITMITLIVDQIRPCGTDFSLLNVQLLTLHNSFGIQRHQTHICNDMTRSSEPKIVHNVHTHHERLNSNLATATCILFQPRSGDLNKAHCSLKIPHCRH